MSVLTIGLCGKRGSGKSSLAELVKIKMMKKFSDDIPILAFAGSLKRLCTVVTKETVKSEKIKSCKPERILKCSDDFGILYDIISIDQCLEILSKIPHEPDMTYGRYLQLVGSAMREFDEDIWVKSVIRKIENTDVNFCIIEDVRHPNEAEICDIIFEIRRKGPKENDGRDDSHESEQNPTWPTTVIENNGTLEESANFIMAGIMLELIFS